MTRVPARFSIRRKYSEKSFFSYNVTNLLTFALRSFLSDAPVSITASIALPNDRKCNHNVPAGLKL